MCPSRNLFNGVIACEIPERYPPYGVRWNALTCESCKISFLAWALTPSSHFVTLAEAEAEYLGLLPGKSYKVGYVGKRWAELSDDPLIQKIFATTPE